jgi:hypothetical protein
VLVVVALATTAAVALGVRYALTQEADEYAARVNGESISQESVDETIEQNQRTIELRDRGLLPEGAQAPPTDRGVVTTQLIEQRLLSQEARRRGASCSDAELDAEIARQRALQADQPEYAIAAAIQNGMLDITYLDTPEAERTPSAAEAANLFWTNSDTAAFLRRTCERGKVIQSLDDPTPDTPYDQNDRNAAIASLMEQLKNNAQIERAVGY